MGRRAFLGAGALGGLGWTFLRNGSLAFGARANEKLNIAVIGAGGQGEGNAGNVASENIAALCDVDQQRCANTLRRFPNAKKFTDFRKLLEELQAKIDAVVVSTPDHTHAVAAVAAMQLGLHCYCEKPLNRTILEARTMRAVASSRKVVTQMGNQGSASEGLRRGVELAWGGAIGAIGEAHVWFGSGNSGAAAPKDTPPVPPTLEWDLWLGPATYKPYHPEYAPGRWRNWRHFGTGVLGDFGCHSINMAFRALRLDRLWSAPAGAAPAPVIRVEGEAAEINPDSYPRWCKVVYRFPARGDLPPARLTWYNGGPRPPEDLLPGRPLSEHGSALMGEKGVIFSDCPWNTRCALLPEKQFEGFDAPRTLPRSPGHHAEWIQACKGGPRPFSPFELGGPMTELLLLGHIAMIVGQPIEYDPVSGTIANSPEASRLLHREYREGWKL
ncbi:MAG: Gfo/Idh/MocA family oxidoreductase [Planctomycetes bacterium]|jgi:hypothetical protein|nr:Gfo/Idh/MocA family oxidoreductase [Planctomycetota bacterium]